MGADAVLVQPEIVTVGELESLPDGRRRLITSVEAWTDRVIVRWVEAPAPERSHASTQPLWEMTDDAGTEYRCSGSGGHGGPDRLSGDVRFHPGIPAKATTLRLRTPEGREIQISTSA